MREQHDQFTLITYPQGRKEVSTLRWFRAEAPISWGAARDRLISCGIIDPKLAGRTHEPGGWMLSIDPTQFHAARAELLPLPSRGTATSQDTATILLQRDRKGEAREALLDTARGFGSGNARHGDVIAAAVRYTAQLIKEWGYGDLAADLEKVAQGAEDVPL